MISWKKSLNRIYKKFNCSYILLIFGLYLLYKCSTKELFGSPKQLVYFHMETCSHCKRFNPEWGKFSREYNGELTLKKIEANEAGDLLQKYKITGFPTILLIDEYDNTKAFTGNRNVEGLENFINT